MARAKGSSTPLTTEHSGASVAVLPAKPTAFLDRFDEVVRRTPTKTAIVDLSFEPACLLTYADLDALADRVATRLIELGVRTEQAVAYQLPSGWEFIAITLGIWRAGGVACPILPSLRERELRFILDSSGSNLLIVPETFRGFDYRPLAQSVCGTVSQDVEVFVLPSADTASDERRPEQAQLAGLLADTADQEALRRRRPPESAVAQLLYTSGTTGEPKGVLHTFTTLSYALASHRDALGLTAEDTVWVPSPLAHQTGFLYGMMVSHYNGSTGVYQATWSVETARQAIVAHQARFVQAAMPFLADITRCPQPPVGLRMFVATGAAVPRQLADDARQALQCAVLGAWGSTECCLVTVGRPDDPPEKQWSTDGRVIDGMAVRIVDDRGLTLAPGVEGNFQVRTPAMFPTYLHHHEWYLGSFAGDGQGFFDTGDLAVMDAAGYIRLTGRKKDVINRGGEKVPVAEIEDVLYKHPALVDVAIVAMPDARLGERACAFIVAKSGQTPPGLDEVCAFLKAEGVAKIYWPERIEPTDTLPRTPSGKVQKFVLRERIAKQLAEVTE